VAELTILLDPLQAQIKALQFWQQYQLTALLAKSQSTDSTFDDAIKTRDVHLESLKRLLYRARELQALVSLSPHASLYHKIPNDCEAISNQQYRHSKSAV
jgi:hypothetical protein